MTAQNFKNVCFRYLKTLLCKTDDKIKEKNTINTILKS